MIGIRHISVDNRRHKVKINLLSELVLLIKELLFHLKLLAVEYISWVSYSMEFISGREETSSSAAKISWVCSLMAQSSRQMGTVKWFSQQKGFGFITPDAGGDDLFVHQTSIQSDGYRSLSEGEAVEFSIDNGNSGRTKAVDVTSPNGSVLAGGGGGRGYSGVRDRGGSYTGNFGWGKSGGRSYGGGSCYNCGKFGHMARDCQEAGRGSGGRYGGGRYGGGGNGGGGCFNCGEQGHFARECPNCPNGDRK